RLGLSPAGVSLPDASGVARNSRIPSLMVAARMPVAAATCLMPPGPTSNASAAAHRRRRRPLKKGRRRSCFARICGWLLIGASRHDLLKNEAPCPRQRTAQVQREQGADADPRRVGVPGRLVSLLGYPARM